MSFFTIVLAAIRECPSGYRALLVFCVTTSLAYGQQLPWNRRNEFKQAGYTELTGPDAARFLVGNSVIVPADDGKDGIISQKQIYYFRDEHVAYVCGTAGGIECRVGSWFVDGDNICGTALPCSSFVVLRSPNWQQWASNDGKLGVFLTENHFANEIVKGDWSGAALFDTRVQLNEIELDSSDLVSEIAEAARLNLQDGQVRIVGQRAISLLVGNTFLAMDAGVNDGSKEACPREGDYFSPAGIIVHFSCGGSPDPTWGLAITRWKIVSGLLCRSYVDDPEQFACKTPAITAVPVPGDDRKMRVLDYSGEALIADSTIGYSGNIFNFRFGDQNR